MIIKSLKNFILTLSILSSASVFSRSGIDFHIAQSRPFADSWVTPSRKDQNIDFSAIKTRQGKLYCLARIRRSSYFSTF